METAIRGVLCSRALLVAAAFFLFTAGASSPKLHAEVHPGLSAKSLNAAGIAAVKAGELDEALADFHRAEQLEPGNPGIAFNIGLTEVRL